MRAVALRTYQVPDLRRIDREAWPAVLARLPGPRRLEAAGVPGIAKDAIPIALSLPPPPSHFAREALREGPALPAPEVRRTGRRPQVAVRLTPEEHDELRTAARMLGMTPTAAARMCIVTGARRAIAAHDAALERLSR